MLAGRALANASAEGRADGVHRMLHRSPSRLALRPALRPALCPLPLSARRHRRRRLVARLCLRPRSGCGGRLRVRSLRLSIQVVVALESDFGSISGLLLGTEHRDPARLTLAHGSGPGPSSLGPTGLGPSRRLGPSGRLGAASALPEVNKHHLGRRAVDRQVRLRRAGRFRRVERGGLPPWHWQRAWSDEGVCQRR